MPKETAALEVEIIPCLVVDVLELPLLLLLLGGGEARAAGAWNVSKSLKINANLKAEFVPCLVVDVLEVLLLEVAAGGAVETLAIDTRMLDSTRRPYSG